MLVVTPLTHAHPPSCRYKDFVKTLFTCRAPVSKGDLQCVEGAVLHRLQNLETKLLGIIEAQNEYFESASDASSNTSNEGSESDGTPRTPPVVDFDKVHLDGVGGGSGGGAGAGAGAGSEHTPTAS